MDPASALPTSAPPGAPRLDSWKEIAAYLKRDVRTVRRWEAAEGLPVHRHLHRARHSVYAFPSEIDAWWDNGHRVAEDPPAARRNPWRPMLVSGVAAITLAATTAGSPLVHDANPSGAGGPGSMVDSRLVDVGVAQGAPSRDPKATELYLVGRQLLNRRAGSLRTALPYLERAVARDPTFAAAHAALGEAYLRVALRAEPAERAQAWADADAAIRRALTLDDRLAAGHATIGWLYMFRDWNWALARAELVRAIELDPRDPNVHSNYALYLRHAGRTDEAIEQRQLARAADPVRVDLTVWLGLEYLFARRYDHAIETFERALELEPAYIPALDGIADGLERKGLYERAAAAKLRLFAQRGATELATGFETVFRREGYRAAAAWLDRRSIDEFNRRPDVNAWDLAYTYARLDDREAALSWLAKAIDLHDQGVLQIRVDPDLDVLRSDPRFQALVARMGIWP